MGEGQRGNVVLRMVNLRTYGTGYRICEDNDKGLKKLEPHSISNENTGLPSVNQ